MFIPVGTYMQFIEHVDKDADGNISSQKVMGVRVRLINKFKIHLSYTQLTMRCSQYVPLTDQHKQLENSSES